MLRWGISKPVDIVAELKKTKKRIITNKYPGMSSLCHKNMLGDIHEFAQLIAKKEYKFMPTTFDFAITPCPKEKDRFEKYS